jgi:ATP synthase protein I
MPNDSEQTKLGLALSVGSILAGNIVGGILAGYLLDRWLKTAPWLVVVGLVLGTAGAFAGVYRVMNRLGGGS